MLMAVAQCDSWNSWFCRFGFKLMLLAPWSLIQSFPCSFQWMKAFQDEFHLLFRLPNSLFGDFLPKWHMHVLFYMQSRTPSWCSTAQCFSGLPSREQWSVLEMFWSTHCTHICAAIAVCVFCDLYGYNQVMYNIDDHWHSWAVSVWVDEVSDVSIWDNRC